MNQVTYKDLLNQLPGSWQEFKLKDFQKIVDVEVTEHDNSISSFVGADNTLKVISKLTDVALEQLEELPIYQVAQLSNKIGFISQLPEPDKKSSIKWKKLEEITYDDFITYQQLQSKALQHLPVLIKAYSKDAMTVEQIGELNMLDVYTGFFLLRKAVKKSVKRSLTSSTLQLIKQSAKEKVKKLFRFKVRTKK